jgi:hypothetical protein
MTTVQRITGALKRVLEAVTLEAGRNPAFASSLEKALEVTPELGRKQAKRPHRRSPGVIDPFSVFAEAGEDGVRRSLSQLSIEQLKDVVAEHGMDRSKLAMKWKTSDRFVDLIIETVASRSRKGDAFR